MKNESRHPFHAVPLTKNNLFLGELVHSFEVSVKMEETIAVLQKYKRMVEENKNHHYLLQERTMIQFLVYILESPNDIEVGLGLEVIHLMAENPQDHSQLRSSGLLEALDKLSKRDGNSNAELANKIVTLLKKTPPPTITKNTTPAHMFPSVIYVLQVPGLTSVVRRDVEYAVVCQRGVISVVIDLSKERCTVRTLSKVTPIDLANSICTKTGLPVKLVTKNNKGREVFKDLVQPPESNLDVSVKSIDADSSQNDHSLIDDVDLPEYLPEEDPPVTAGSLSTFARWKSGAASIVKSASSFFSDSFYW